MTELNILKLSQMLAMAVLVCNTAVYAEGASALDCNKALRDSAYHNALSIAEKLMVSDKTNREALLCKAKAHLQLDQNEAALNTAQLAELQAKAPEEHMYGQVLIGDIQKSAKQLEDALASFNQTLKLSQQFQNKRFERLALNKIGDVLLIQNQAKSALDYFTAGSKLALNDNERADNYERMAAGHAALKQYDLATEYQVKAVHMDEAIGDPERLANAYIDLAALYTITQSYASAENTLGKLIRLSQGYSNQYYEVKANIHLARVKNLAGDKVAASRLMQEAIAQAKKIGADDLLKESQIN